MVEDVDSVCKWIVAILVVTASFAFGISIEYHYGPQKGEKEEVAPSMSNHLVSDRDTVWWRLDNTTIGREAAMDATTGNYSTAIGRMANIEIIGQSN